MAEGAASCEIVGCGASWGGNTDAISFDRREMHIISIKLSRRHRYSMETVSMYPSWEVGVVYILGFGPRSTTISLSTVYDSWGR